MTDFPAVIYLKAESFLEKQDISEIHNDGSETNNISKKPRSHKKIIPSKDQTDSYKKLLAAMDSVITEKMNKIEESLEVLSQNCEKLEGKINIISSLFDSSSFNNNMTVDKFTDDFPDGSWLGFQNNPEMRVRCKIKPRDLHQINKKCTIPVKMALTLLDHLFDRETQASSNISGLGKHKKKQLDPLVMYGIRCHLMHRFDITEDDWTKIKIHMDSKCRTAFRRKLKGMSIASKNTPTY